MTAFSRTSLPPTVRVSDSGRAPLWLWPGSVEVRPKRRFDAFPVEPLESNAEHQTEGTTFNILRVESLEGNLLEQVEALASLPKDWDSYGGIAPSRGVIDSTLRFLVELDKRADALGIQMTEPRLLAGGDGTVGLLWRLPVGDASVEIVFHEGGIEVVRAQQDVITEGLLQSPDEVLALLAK